MTVSLNLATERLTEIDQDLTQEMIKNQTEWQN